MTVVAVVVAVVVVGFILFKVCWRVAPARVSRLAP